MDKSLKSILGLILFTVVLTVAGCSNVPNTVSGLRSSPQSLEASGSIPREQVLFAFEPFDGIPVNLGDLLTKSLTTQGPSYNIRVTPRTKNDATYRVRGYLVAASDDTSTIISYVYDVFDLNGARVHRVTGQEIGGASLGDPWSSVADGTINQIATRTLIELRNWLYSQG